jgi:hypothetical protein
MDELRDYRFYGDDLLHPSEKASAYIWEKFKNALIHQDSHQIIAELDPLLRMREHRPIHQEGEAYLKMIRQLEEKLQGLKEKYPFLSWEKLTDE